LVHISEMGAERRIGHPREVVNVGDQVEARVLSIDRDKRRIGLSLDTARSTPEDKGTQAFTDTPGSFGTLGDLLRESMDKRK
jgi:small subunit ribosomal protein S1